MKDVFKEKTLTTLGQCLLACLMLGIAIFLIWQFQFQEVKATTTEQAIELSINSKEPIVPLPLTLDLDKRKVALGEKLFHDVRLSKDNSISCASCHNLATGGTNPLAKSLGVGGAHTHRNTPTVYNSVFNIAQFWDGRAENLEEQISGPLTSPSEMGSDWNMVLDKLANDKLYTQSFKEIYSEGMTQTTIVDAIATFERSLITPNARFDRYLKGEKNILTEDELEGYALFKDFGCVSCHQGVNVGGNMFQYFGVFKKERHTDGAHDLGREHFTGNKGDRFVFKVPSLRNIAQTAPYFHDGSANTLEEAVDIMASVQLGRILTQSECKKIVSFLKTLTGEYKGEPL